VQKFCRYYRIFNEKRRSNRIVQRTERKKEDLIRISAEVLKLWKFVDFDAMNEM